MYRIRGKIVIYVRQMFNVRKLCAAKEEKKPRKNVVEKQKKNKIKNEKPKKKLARAFKIRTRS